MTRFSGLAVPLLVAALATFAVASAQGAKPPPPPGKGPKLTITPASTTLGPVDPGVGASQEFVLGFKDGKTSGELAAAVSGDGFTVTDDDCTGTALKPGQTCSVTVTYTPSGYGESVEGTLTVTGKPDVKLASALLFGTSTAAGNRAPAGEDYPFSVPRDTPTTITLEGWDQDGDALTFALVDGSGPAHGTLGAITNTSCDAGECSAQIVYSPTEAYAGADSFSYTVNDGQLDSAAITVSITVYVPQNYAPQATYGLSFHTNVSTTFLLAGTDPNIGDQLTFEITTQPTHGTFGAISTPSTCAGTPWTCTAAVTYTPTAGYVGPDRFQFRAYDGKAYSNSAYADITVNPAVVGDEPWADPKDSSYSQDQTVTLTLTGGDPNGGPLTFQIVTSVGYGSLSAPASVTCSSGVPSICQATVVYTPPPGFHGADSFTYRTFDGVNYSVAQIFTLHAS